MTSSLYARVSLLLLTYTPVQVLGSIIVDLFASIPHLRSRWLRTLKRAISRGWKIKHLVRREADRARAMFLVECMIELLDTSGSYILRHFASESVPPHAGEIILVPGKGALEIYFSGSGGHVDLPLFYSEDEEHFHTLRNHVTLLARCSTSMIETYLMRSVQFSQAIADAEDIPGDRYLIMDGLSEVTVPIQIHKDRARPFLENPAGEQRLVEGILRSRTRRQQTFERQLTRWHVRDICPTSAIVRLIEDGVPSRDDIFLRLGLQPLTLEQRIAHLEEVIRLLRTYPNYELGLLDDRLMDSEDHMYRTFWMVKASHIVLLETSRPGAKGKTIEVDLTITEPTIVDGFREYFNSRIWNQLPEVNRNRDAVIDWLREQIRLVK